MIFVEPSLWVVGFWGSSHGGNTMITPTLISSEICMEILGIWVPLSVFFWSLQIASCVFPLLILFFSKEKYKAKQHTNQVLISSYMERTK